MIVLKILSSRNRILAVIKEQSKIIYWNLKSHNSANKAKIKPGKLISMCKISQIS